MLKKLWEKWKVSISFVSGALVVASAYGTCTVEPDKEAITKEITKEKADEVDAPPVEEPKSEQPEPKEDPKEEAEGEE